MAFFFYTTRQKRKIIPRTIKIPPIILKISPKLKTATGRITPKTARIILKDKASAKKTNGIISKDNKNMEPSLLKPDSCPAYLLFSFAAVFLKVFVKIVVRTVVVICAFHVFFIAVLIV